MPKNPTSDFAQFRSQLLTLLCAGAASLPPAVLAPLLDYMVSIGPPCVGRLALAGIAGLVDFVVALYCFQFIHPRDRTDIANCLKKCLFWLVVIAAVYYLAFQVLVVRVDEDHRYVRGLHTPHAVQYLAENPDKTEADMIDDASHKIDRIYEWRSMAAAEVSLTLVWVAAFADFSFVIALFLILFRKASVSAERARRKAEE